MNDERPLYASPGVHPDPLIINSCLTGIVPTKAVCPHVPLTVDEIVEDAGRVLDAGATMLHLHARDAAGAPSSDPELYARIVEGVRRIAPEAVLVVTTSGRVRNELASRAAVLDLDGAAKPDMASLTLGSLNFPKSASVTDPEMVRSLAARMAERGILPELEVFEPGMLNYGLYLRAKGLLPERCYVNLLLGSLGASPGRVSDLCNLVRDVPPEWTWAAAGIGRFQLRMNVAAMVMGGHVRVGIEDNPFFEHRSRTPASNAALVERLARIAGELDRPIARPGETRAMLGLAAWRAPRASEGRR